jgi:lactoylglutathione lyase
MTITLEHVAIWTHQLEVLKTYYTQYFNGIANHKYTNTNNGFESYFIKFNGGARLELMQMPTIPNNLNDTIQQQHTGIIHLAFGVATIQEVDAKAAALQAAGFTILKGPRVTGDGYYEFETLDPDQNRIEVTTVYQPIVL